MKFLALLAAGLPAMSAMALSTSVLDARQSTTTKFQTIHPNGDKTKCIGVLGGKFTIGAYVDIYDCNGSVTQKWGRGEGADGYFVKNPANGENLCMDIENPETAQNGAKVLLARCAREDSEDGIWHQSMDTPSADNGYTIRSVVSVPSNSGQGTCLDLTEGSKENRNVLQIWTCSPDAGKPYKNQVWKVADV